MSIFEHDIYVELRSKRIKAIINYYGKDWFRDKKILELGCGNADIGNSFYEMGAMVTATDAREEHLKLANEKYPHIKTVLFDLELPDWPFDENYDLILHTGVLYHLKNYEKNLVNCLNHCDNMFLECVTADSDDDNYVEYIPNEIGDDQSFCEIGCRASEKNIEKIMKENHFEFYRYFKSELNSKNNVFDWKIKNTKSPLLYDDGNYTWLRRAWFCKK